MAGINTGLRKPLILINGRTDCDYGWDMRICLESGVDW